MKETILLYGPPGSGKSTLGSLLAKSLGLPFFDMDQEIETASSRSIAWIFANQGEQRFRELELQELHRLAAQRRGVIALGGGALTRPGAREAAEAAGQVLLLHAGAEILLERLQGAGRDERPLLNGDTASRLAALLERRGEHYASFPLQLDTSGLDLESAAWEAQVSLGMFRVAGMGAPYDVRAMPGGLAQVGEMLLSRGLRGPVALVSDQTVGGLYAAQVEQSIHNSGYECKTILIPAGEEHKTIETITRLWEGFLQAGIERSSTVLALGGGVVGDQAGFAAATWMRGVRWVYLPTTLLAMADASLGGKTGIDLPQGKNLAGAFHPPSLVLADTTTLETLPEAELRSGMAEVIKHGVIADPRLFELALGGSRARLDELVRRSMAVKARIIQADPFEQGQRAALNLGHTIGHALELVTGFGLRHGEAVAIGMVLEARLAERCGLAPAGLAETIARAAEQNGLPGTAPAGISAAAILEAMQRDKKRLGGSVHFALPLGIGAVKSGVVIENLEEELCRLF